MQGGEIRYLKLDRVREVLRENYDVLSWRRKETFLVTFNGIVVFLLMCLGAETEVEKI